MKKPNYNKFFDFSKKIFKTISNNRLLSLIIIILFLPYVIQGLESVNDIIKTDVFGYKTVYIIKMTKPISYETIDIDLVYNTLKDFKGDGMILYIDSPGGSIETYKIVKALRNFTKPSVCYIHYYGTSGAYWICSLTNKIVSEDFAIVGSVGGIMTLYDISGLLEKLGINVTIIKTGEYKDVGTPFRELTPEEKQWLERQLQFFVEEFKKDVKENRELVNETDIFSAKWYFGVEAKQIGLVDEIGDYDTAKKDIVRMLNVSEDKIIFKIIDPTKKKSWFQEVFGTYYKLFQDIYSKIIKIGIKI